MTQSPHQDAVPGSHAEVEVASEEVRDVGAILNRLLDDEAVLPNLEEAMRTNDVASFAELLERAGVSERTELICRWICSWHIQRVCFWLCRDVPMDELSVDEAREATIAFAALAQSEGALSGLVESLDRLDADAFHSTLKEFGLLRWARLVCVWVLTVRCQLFCYRLAAGPRTKAEGDLVVSLRNMAAAAGKLAARADDFAAVLDAHAKGDVQTVRAVLERLDLIKYCRLFCWWLCILVPFLRCIRICLLFDPVQFGPVPKPTDPGPIREWAKAVVDVAADDKAVAALTEAAVRGSDDDLAGVVKELDLIRWCPYLCFWLRRLICLRFCYFLCPPRPPLPYFYKLGTYDYTSHVDAGIGGTGLTTPDHRAFYSTVRLNGSALQKQYNGGAPEYRFEVFLPGAADWSPVLPAQIAPTNIGSFTRVGLITPKQYVVNGTGGPDEITIPVAADGWIAVPTANNYWTAEGFFSSTGDYLNLQTSTLLAWPVHDVSTVDAGDDVPPGQRGADQVISIRMSWRKVGDLGGGIEVGTAHSVAVCNDIWNQVQKFGSWVPTRVNGQLAVVSVNIDEIGAGCADVTDQLHVRYTAEHPNLGPVTLTLTGPGGFSLSMVDDAAASPPTVVFGVAEVTAPSTAKNLFKCTYVVELAAEVLLTTGDSEPSPVKDMVAFHKS